MAVENFWCWRCCRCLADIDVDGNLAADEFCVAMYLIDMAKMGQSLPATLPPGLVPPSMQRLRRSSETPAATQLPCNCTHNCPCLNDFLCLSVCLSVILCPYWEISGTSQNNHQSVFHCLYQHLCRYSVCICWSRPCAYTNG